MKICLASDIHHPRSRVLMGRFLELVQRSDADVFVLAGDLCDGITTRFQECLSYFEQIEVPKCIVLGNHDIWLRDTWMEFGSSESKLHKLLDISQEAGFHPLWRGPLLLEEVAIAGNIGWYDYGFRSIPLPSRVYEKKRYRGYVWNDAAYIKWRYSDVEFNDLCLRRLGKDLADLQENAKVRDIIVVTHHVPFDSCVLRKGIETFDFFNAYMGSPLTGELIQNHEKVSNVAFGHSHGRGIPEQRRWRIGRILAHNVCVNFYDPRPYTLHIGREASERQRDDS